MSKVNPHVDNVCKIGQENLTCRYLAVSAHGWSCEKRTPLKNYIDSKVATGSMRAQGDNCEGKETQFLNAERS